MTAFTGTELAASENAWIPTRPASWQLSRLKWTVRFSANGIWGDDADGGYDDIACIRVADFDRQRLRIAAIEPTMRSIPRSAQQNRRLKIGDLLLEKSGGGGNQPVGVVVLYDLRLDAVCSNFVARVVVSPGNDSGFFTYLHASLYYGRVNTRSIKQTTGIQNLDADLYFDEVVALPPVHTQQAIADYLDEKTADLDALIEKKRKLLDLLDEERAALINQAVTKGIDPNVPMKDSGIPWVGEMPAHWRVKRLRHISPQQSVGVVINPSTYVDDAGDIPFIYGGEVSEGEISIVDARRISAQSNRLLRKSQLRAGDLVCVRVGDPGVTAVVPPALDGINCASVMIIRQASTFSSEWLCYAMNSQAGRQNIALVAYGAAQKQYNIGHAVDFIYPTPPKTEQDIIVKWLDSTLAGVQETLTAIVSQIDRLQEYRQALITAAVTGQLDLGAAA